MSTAGNSYENWKESLTQAEAAGTASLSEASEPLSATELGLELKGLGTLVLAGIGLLIASSFFLLLNYDHLTKGEETTGIVIGYQERYHRRSGRSYAPVVDYSAPGGPYQIVGQVSAVRSMYPVNREVRVLYLPDDPSNGVIADFVQLYVFPTILGSLGVLCLVGAGGLTVWIVRKSGWRLLPG